MASRLAVGNEDGDIALFDINAERIIRSIKLGARVPKLKFDGNRLFAANGRNVYCFSTADMSLISAFRYPPNAPSVTDFHLYGGNLHISAGRDVRSWDVRRPKIDAIMFQNDHNITCVDYIPLKHLILMGDTKGRIQGWNVRNQFHQHKEVGSYLPITCIGVSPHQDWFGVGNCRGEFLPYLCSNQIIKGDNLLLDGVLGDALQKCTFPQHVDGQQYPILAFEANIGRYNPLIKKLSWKKNVIRHLPFRLRLPHKLRSCAVNGNGTRIYSGLDNGNVVSYQPPPNIDDAAAEAHLDAGAAQAHLGVTCEDLSYLNEEFSIEEITGEEYVIETPPSPPDENLVFLPLDLGRHPILSLDLTPL